MASAARRGTGIAGLVWRTSNLSVSAAPTIRMYSNSAPVFAAAMRIPASFPRFAGLTSRRWMSTEKEGEVGEGSGAAAGTANEAADATSSVQTEGGSLDDTPDPVYDPELLKKLELTHVPPKRIAEVLAQLGAETGDEDMTLEKVALLMRGEEEVDEEVDEEEEDELEYQEQQIYASGFMDELPPRTAPPEVFDPLHDVRNINPKFKFFVGGTYEAKDLSPLSMNSQWKDQRNELRKRGCPLGGKKGPKIEYTNVRLLNRFLSQAGQIMSRKQTFVCAKKQRELARAIKRARQMALLPYTAKLEKFY